MRTARTHYVLALALAVATVVFLILAVGALGIIGDGGRADRAYAAVLIVGAVGTTVARLRPGGMALVLVAMAFTQVLATTIVLLTGLHLDENASVVDILGITAMYAALFGLSAWLFKRASDERSEVAVSGRS
jgi:hypothetical protein